GIRDFHVTGVQTCALPISLVAAGGWAGAVGAGWAADAAGWASAAGAAAGADAASGGRGVAGAAAGSDGFGVSVASGMSGADWALRGARAAVLRTRLVAVPPSSGVLTDKCEILASCERPGTGGKERNGKRC